MQLSPVTTVKSYSPVFRNRLHGQFFHGRRVSPDCFASGGIEAADFFEIPIFVAVAAISLSGETRHA
ncbi:hypothetical protein ACLBKU_13845 [Erythrobacter sp. NE805]|uniref:hypothetical protein n=1 Tax=Erythrobacter sp. NE805 TaxID=3389875 RepID=UPI00396AEFFA